MIKRTLLFLFCVLSLAATPFEKYEQKAEKFNEASFQAALKKSALTLVELTPVRSDSRDPALKDYVVLLPPGEKTVEFVKDKDGKIYQLIRDPKVIQSKTRTLNECGPAGRGAMAESLTLTFQGVSGEKTLAYNVKEAVTEYKPSSPCRMAP
jgi:hypothetical protein